MAVVVAAGAVAVEPTLPVTCVAWVVAWAVLLPLEAMPTVAVPVVMLAVVVALVALPPTVAVAAVVATAATAADMATRPALLDHPPGGRSVVVSGEAVGPD